MVSDPATPGENDLMNGLEIARSVPESPVAYAGIYVEDHTAYGSPTQRSNLVSTGVFQVKSLKIATPQRT